MDIQEIRKEIDNIDNQILNLIEKRQEFAKQTNGFKKDVISFKREQEIYSRLKSDHIPNEQVRNIFTEIISSCKKSQRELNVAYLGPEGSFTNIAAIKKFGSSVNLLAQESFEDVFNAIKSKQADLGVLPVENSIEGSVNLTLDLLQDLDSEIRILSEMNLKIIHNLMGSDKFTKIYSHPQAFAQCRSWIKKNYPNAELIEKSSTSKAAEIAKSEGQAAIASSYVAKKYDLSIINESIQDNQNNITRFIVLGTQSNELSEKNKTSIVFSVKHKSGALFDAIEPFKKYNINLTKIESRPNKKTPWEYVFFVDFQGHPEQENVKSALKEIEDKCNSLKILGTFPEDSAVL